MSADAIDYANMPMEGLTEDSAQPETTEHTETEQETDVADEQTAEDDESGEEKPFRAWELPKPAAKTPHAVPYDRFREVHSEREALFQDNKEMARRLQELEQQIAKANEVPNPDDLNPADFETPQAYLAARDKAIAAKIRADIKAELAQEEQQRIQAQQADQLWSTSQANLTAQAKEDPNVHAAYKFFDDYADQLQPVVGAELLRDPNVGHVMVRIATNKELLTQLFRGTPDQGIRLINRISARIDAERESKTRAPAGDEVPEPLQRTAQPAAARRAPAPIQVKPTGTPKRTFDLYKDADKMTLAQWRKARGL